MADEKQEQAPEEQAAAQEEQSPSPQEEAEVAQAEAEPKESEAQAEAEAAEEQAAQAEEAAEPEAAEEEEPDEEEPDEEEQAAAQAEETEEQPDADGQAEDAEQAAQTREHEVTIEQLLKAGAHFGHLTSRWHPRMEPYIFMKRNNIHIIDLMQTQVLLDKAADAARRFAKRGKTILFAGTKKQAQEIVREHAEAAEQPFMVNRWLGGTMTNFQTIRRSIRRMENLEKMEKDGTFDKLKKKERLTKIRERQKLEDVLGGIRQMANLPGALYVVDVRRENIAVSEARKLGIPIIAMVDTNCDPTLVDYPIPANDDALSSIEVVTSVIGRAIQEGATARESEEKARQKQQS